MRVCKGGPYKIKLADKSISEYKYEGSKGTIRVDQNNKYIIRTSLSYDGDPWVEKYEIDCKVLDKNAAYKLAGIKTADEIKAAKQAKDKKPKTVKSSGIDWHKYTCDGEATWSSSGSITRQFNVNNVNISIAQTTPTYYSNIFVDSWDQLSSPRQEFPGANISGGVLTANSERMGNNSRFGFSFSNNKLIVQVRRGETSSEFQGVCKKK